MTYHEEQLKQIEFDLPYVPTIQIRSGNSPSKTKWMDLNKDSIPIIIDWLKSLLPAKEPSPDTMTTDKKIIKVMHLRKEWMSLKPLIRAQQRICNEYREQNDDGNITLLLSRMQRRLERIENELKALLPDDL